MSSPLRKCTITGTSDQIANAKGLLDEKIAEDNEIRARRGDIAMPRNRRAARKLDSAYGKFLFLIVVIVVIVLVIIVSSSSSGVHNLFITHYCTYLIT